MTEAVKETKKKIEDEVEQVGNKIFTKEERKKLSQAEQRASIALGMESLKLHHIQVAAKEHDLLVPDVKKVPSRTVSVTDRIKRVVVSAIQASRHNKACRKLFRSINGLEKEKIRHREHYAWIIHPFSLMRWYWDLVMVVALIITLIFLPMEMAFSSDQVTSQTWTIINIICDFVFFIDLILNFRTGYVEACTESVILDSKLIALHYIKTWFAIDFLSSIPFDYLYEGFMEEQDDSTTMTLKVLKVLKLAKLLSLLRIFRMARLLRYLQKLEELLDIDVQAIRIINLIMVMILFAHWDGCLEYLVVYIEGFPKDSFVVKSNLHLPNTSFTDKYTASLFRAMSHMLSIGYGQHRPSSTMEKWVTLVSMTLGSTFYALFIANLSALLMTMDASGRQYEEKLSQVKEYMRFRRVPLKLQAKVLDYYEHKYQRKYFDENTILSGQFMSHTLRQEVLVHNCKDLLHKVAFLADAPQDFLLEIIGMLTFQVFFPGEHIITAGKTGDCMYFIEHGSVDIVLPDGRTMNKLVDGDHFGEIALLTDERRVASVVAAEICDVYILRKDDFNAAVNDHPDMRKIMERVASKRLKEAASYMAGRRNEEKENRTEMPAIGEAAEQPDVSVEDVTELQHPPYHLPPLKEVDSFADH